EMLQWLAKGRQAALEINSPSHPISAQPLSRHDRSFLYQYKRRIAYCMVNVGTGLSFAFALLSNTTIPYLNVREKGKESEKERMWLAILRSDRLPIVQGHHRDSRFLQSAASVRNSLCHLQRNHVAGSSSDRDNVRSQQRSFWAHASSVEQTACDSEVPQDRLRDRVPRVPDPNLDRTDPFQDFDACHSSLHVSQARAADL